MIIQAQTGTSNLPEFVCLPAYLPLERTGLTRASKLSAHKRYLKPQASNTTPASKIATASHSIERTPKPSTHSPDYPCTPSTPGPIPRDGPIRAGDADLSLERSRVEELRQALAQACAIPRR
jgi:hypothetical protein